MDFEGSILDERVLTIPVLAFLGQYVFVFTMQKKYIENFKYK